MSSQGSRRESRDGSQRNGFLSVATSLAFLFSLAACQPNANISGIERSGDARGIVNGIDANGSEPFAGSVVGIASKKPSGEYSVFCSGTIISEHMVLTAAHCLPHIGNDNYVVFGVSAWKANLQVRQITRKAAHENYANWFPSTAKDVFDIGVIQFSGGLPAGYHPMPILADDSILQPGTEVVMVGYGVTSGASQSGSGTMRYTTIRIAEAHGETELKTDEAKSGTCNGDSGGPGLIFHNGRYYLWGATSRGDSYCRNHGIYTKATSYRAWIHQKSSSWLSLMAEDEASAYMPYDDESAYTL